MSSIEKYISPFIAQQFPQFYRAEGPNFIAFVKAYYEWLEQSNSAIGEARSLLQYSDIDTTIASFIQHFKNQYVVGLPDSVLADKQLLIKHIADLYKSKGSKRAYELLFRLAFGEEIDLYLPGEYIFKPSDNTWKVPRYLEVSSSPVLNSLVGRTITNAERTATAIVESYSKRTIQGRVANALEVTGVTGQFVNGDKLLPLNGETYSVESAPTVVGSLIAIAITDGGQNYSVGDVLDVSGSGIEGKARVAAISNNFSGAIQFILADGGSGYTTNALVTVATTINLQVANTNGSFVVGESVKDSTTNANGTVSFANSTFVQLINFSPVLTFSRGNILQGSVANAVIIRASGGVGSGASFKVGSIINKELITFSTTVINPYLNLELDNATANAFILDVSSVSGTFNANDTVQSSANGILLEGIPVTANLIMQYESLSNTTLGISGLFVYRADQTLIWCTGTDSDLQNANLVQGVVLVGNSSGAEIQLIRATSKETVSGAGIVQAANSTQLTLSNCNGYFVASATITDSNTAATATIDDAIRVTDWQFANSVALIDNLDSIISLVAPERSVEVGTIGSLTAINPGSGYLTKPFITVVEPDIAALNLYDIDGTVKGNNAIIDSRITAGNGAISAVEVVDSGYGYFDNENVTLSVANNDSVVQGAAIVYGIGKGTGRWLNRKSFPSDVMKLQDGLFYQNYSYEIVAQRMIDSYEQLVRDLVHPAGIALYGRYRSQSYVVDDQDSVVQSQIQQQ